MELLKLRPDHIPEALKLVHGLDAYRGNYSQILPLINLERSLQKEDLVVGLFSGGSMVGFYSLVINPPEFDLLFVSDAYQGKGFGRMLMDSVKHEAKGRGLKALKIISHPPAEKFYLAMGAQKVGEVEPSEIIPWRRPILSLTI